MSGCELVIYIKPAVACPDVCYFASQSSLSAAVGFANRLEAGGAASLFGGFELCPGGNLVSQ